MPLRNSLRAEILLEHAQDRRTFFVGEDVEHRAAVLGAEHGVLDRARALERVDRHRRRRARHRSYPIGSIRASRHRPRASP